MSKINFNTKKQSQSDVPEDIEEARKEMEARKIEDNERKNNKKSKKVLIVFLIFLILITIGAGTYFYLQKQKTPFYEKFIPESSAHITLTPQEITSFLNISDNSAFTQLFSKIKLEASNLEIDIQAIISELKSDIIVIPSLKTAILQLPEGLNTQEIETKIKQNFNTFQETYRGEKIVNVESLSLEKENESFKSRKRK